MVYQIALSLVPGVGSVLGKKLISICGDAEAVFREPERLLRKVPRINRSIFEGLNRKDILERAESEVEFVHKYKIKPMFFKDNDYPKRLKNCIDSPIMLFFKGEADLNVPKIIGIVGTRNATDYGKDVCHRIVSGLKDLNVLVVSGLAFGIDSCAHRLSLENSLRTVGVLGHGLDRIYPQMNKLLAERMIGHGGLITEFLSQTKPDRENFPMRNRIIAGLCDAVIVVEAARKGGALITADIANSYNRDVFAVPGRITDPYSEGTNWLIRTNKAALIQSPEDIILMMGWEDEKKPGYPIQRRIFVEMTQDEQIVTDVLGKAGRTGIDELTIQANLSASRVAAALLNLEFEGVVQCLPGKIYALT